jgi:hypothetical protein
MGERLHPTDVGKNRTNMRLRGTAAPRSNTASPKSAGSHEVYVEDTEVEEEIPTPAALSRYVSSHAQYSSLFYKNLAKYMLVPESSINEFFPKMSGSSNKPRKS